MYRTTSSVSFLLWRSVQSKISLLSNLASLNACSSGIIVYVRLSSRCVIPHSIYWVVLTATGPKFLSAGAMVISGFRFIALRMESWIVVRLEIGGWLTKEELMALPNCWILVTMVCGGGGGLQFDFTRSLLGVAASSVSPAKKILRLKSRSKRSSVVACSSGEVLIFGVGMNLRPRPSSVLAIGGRMSPVVRSWNARFETGWK